MVSMKAHFVEFYSPGTLVAETNVEPIDSWDVEEAMRRARSINQRHGAKPYGFRFFTKERGPHDLDSRETVRSGTYYLGGVIETVEQIEAKGDPSNKILLSNMRGNGWHCVITNTNSYRWTQPFQDGDVLLDFKMDVAE